MLLIGQASGFMGVECSGARCWQDYVVLDPTGNLLYRGKPEGPGGRVQANDPTGGMIHVRFLTDSAGAITMGLLEAIDAGGAVRWTRTLPDTFSRPIVGVDRKGNVLAIWNSDQRYGAGTWVGEWFDHDGTPGPVFQTISGDYPIQFYERVGSGLFLATHTSWGQFDAQATTMSPPPDWLASRPPVALQTVALHLHMVHGGNGYAVLPTPGSSAACEQVVEVISPSGKVCGSSTFAIGGGSCTTSSIIVGYDGTVVQQLPRERELPCTAADHQCDCTYRYWSGYFR
jgi:hypothetical protein